MKVEWRTIRGTAEGEVQRVEEFTLYSGEVYKAYIVRLPNEREMIVPFNSAKIVEE